MESLIDLHGRVHRGAYRAQPSRRVYLEKPDGRKRPLGIAVLEDKIVQGAVVEILNAIYEEDFLGFSYGFRPERGAHDLPMMARFRHRVVLLWRHALIRRGGKRIPRWQKLIPLFERWLPKATHQHPYPRTRFAVKHPRWEPYAGKPLVRICPGGAS